MKINNKTLDPDQAVRGAFNNNHMEHIDGTRSWTAKKTMHGLKKKDTPKLQSCQIIYHYIRPCEGLAGGTPAEMRRIEINGENKWIT